ncbi:MAG: 3-isopropylmalate dehydratase large subunit [Candidatus Geothermarchaeales archaeon]
MPMTIAEKILAEASGERVVSPGDIVNAGVDLAMSHENAALVSRVFREIGVERVWDPNKMVILFDHRVPAESERTAQGHKEVRDFVRNQGIKNFYDMRVGICHQILVELGHVRPGELVVGTDSHTTTHGALGAFGTGIGATDMAGVWATGQIWLRVPENVKINVRGKLPDMVTSKDVALRIIGDLGSEGASYKAVEFAGDAVDGMSISSRMTMSNLSMEMGAKAAIIPPDEKTIEYLRGRIGGEPTPMRSDEAAAYEEEYTFDVGDLEPQVACPHSVDNVKPVGEVEGTPIDQAFLGSCTNGRLEDLRLAAGIMRGRKIPLSARMIVIPASAETYLQAMREGLLEIFIEAGAVVCNPGCGPCLGAHEGLLAPGERCISSSNRNFRGRMGSPESEVYLASPAVVAASAVRGEIADPRRPL